MNKTPYNFESEKLRIDYITLNLKNGKNNIQKIAQFFNCYHQFNCYSYYTKIKSKKSYLIDPSYKLEMVFVFDANPVNRNTILIQFAGSNAYHFYRILKSQKFNWEIFNLDDLSLGRIDISYIRTNHRSDESNISNFLERSRDKFKIRYPTSDPFKVSMSIGLGT